MEGDLMTKKHLLFTAVILAGILSSSAYATTFGFHGYPNHGARFSRLPGPYRTVIVKGNPYVYCGGVFYRHVNKAYVVIAPPIGVVVDILPVGYTTVDIVGRTYFVQNNVYYQRVDTGYQVVEQPAAPQITPSVTQTATPGSTAPGNPDIYDLNIPNTKGGYTHVVIKRSGTGFVGPQGEFYTTFPKIDQLKVMYAQ